VVHCLLRDSLDSAGSLRVHLPTADHNWREHRTGLRDVLATSGRAWSGVTGYHWDGIQEVVGSTPIGSTCQSSRPRSPRYSRKVWIGHKVPLYGDTCLVPGRQSLFSGPAPDP